MILPIYGYGCPVLKKVAKDIEPPYKGVDIFIKDMWESMYKAHGIGLAAPQVGKSIRLFVVDTLQLDDEELENSGIKQVFINAHMEEELGQLKEYEEGCLSIPEIRGDVERQEKVRIRFLDENFKEQIKEYDGINARVIQHEYDHLEGVLFTEKLKPIKKRRIKRKLEDIKKGRIDIDYKMKFYGRKK